MARIKGGMNAKKKHNRVLKMAKGYRGARSKQALTQEESRERDSSDSCGSLVSTLLQESTAYPTASLCTA